MYVHACWAVISFTVGLMFLGGAYMIFPLAGTDGPIGRYVLCLYFGCLSLFILGILGTVFHVVGTLDHLRNFRHLTAKRVRGKKSNS